MARQIVVDIIGDSSKLNKEFDKAGKSAGGFKNVLTGVGQGIGASAFGLVENAIQGVVGTLGEADAAYQEDARSQGLLQAALKANVKGYNGNADAIEEVIASQMKLGFGDEEQRDSLGNLLGITKDVAAAQELQAQAMDLARLKGMDLSAASDLLGKVYGGNLGTLSRYGIVLDENATKEDALAAIQAMSAGQAEAFAKGPLGVQTAAQLKLGESMEKIGQVVNTVSTVVMPILADALANTVDWLAKTWTSIEPVASALVRDLTPAFKVVVSILGTIIGVIGNVVGAVLPPLWNAIKTLGSIWGTIFGGIWTTVTTIFGNVRGAFDSIVRFVTGMPGRIASAAGGMFDGIWQAFKGAINTLIRAWNSIKFTIPRVDVGPVHFGGFTIGTPNIPTFHAGGIVPGVPGSDVPAILQAGERVIPRNEVGGRAITINVYGSVIGTVDELADMLAKRLYVQGV